MIAGIEQILVLAKDDSSGWIETLVTILIIMFIFIGPLLKKLTEGIRKKVAQDRGVKEPKETKKPPPSTDVGVAMEVMDEIASMFNKVPEGPLGGDARTAKKSPAPSKKEPGQVHQKLLHEHKPQKPAVLPKPQKALYARPVPQGRTYAVVETPTKRRREPRYKEEPISQISATQAPEALSAVAAVDHVEKVETVGVKSKVHKADAWKRLPKRLSDNQKAIALAEIFGKPRYDAEVTGPWDM